MRITDLALRLLGATSGEQIIKTAATASGAITLPGGTVDFSGTGPGLVQQASAGAAFTVAATSPSLTVGSPGAVSGGTLTGDLVAQRVIVNANTATAPAPFGVGTIQVVGADVTVPSVEASAFGGASPANGTIGRFICRRANGTGAAPTAVLSGNALGAFNVIGYGATGYSTPRGTLQYNATENWDDTHQGAALNVFATPTGGTATATVATFQTGVMIGAATDPGAGNLNVFGTIAVGNNANPALALYTANYTALYSPDGSAGNGGFIMGNAANPLSFYRNTTTYIQDRAAATTFVTINNSGVLLGAATGGQKGASTLNAVGVYAGGVLLTSDARLKRDIEPLPDGCLELVAAIKPKRFKFIEPEPAPLPKLHPNDPDVPDAGPAGPEGWFDKMRWGFLAQDVEAAMEGRDFGGVDIDAEGHYSLSIGDLLAVLWRAVQELEARR